MSDFHSHFSADDFAFPGSNPNSNKFDVESWLLLADEERVRSADNPPAKIGRAHV